MRTSARRLTKTWLTDLLTAAPELARKLAHLTSIPDIELTTAVVVVAETSGFVLVEDERPLTSYAGLDVVQRQSERSTPATHISRRGNGRLRTAIYLQSAAYAIIRSRWPSRPVCGRGNPAVSPA